MPALIDDKTIQETINAIAKYPNLTQAAKGLGVPRSTLEGRVRIAQERNIIAGVSTVVEVTVESKLISQIESLERENTLLRDKSNSLRTKLKQSHRNQGLFEALCDEIDKVIEPLTPLPESPMKKRVSGNIEQHSESLVMHISDEHADQIVEPHRVGGMEHYNFEVALARAERYVDKVLSISALTLSNYRFDDLWILAYGDHISGEIHDSTNHSEFRNAFDNAMAVGQMHALMIRDLAPHFKSVRVLYLSGNHGRRKPRKDYHGPKDNWDYLVGRTAEMLCTDIKNAEFLIPDSWSYTFDISGWNFCVFHGDDIRSWNNIPHYGIERKTRRLTALHSSQGRQIHYFVMGHFHSRSMMEHPSGEIIINGSWKATDEFAYESLGLITKPSQLLHGVGNKYGVSFRFPIYLKFDGDTDGPKRYTAPMKTLGHLQKLPKI